MGRERETKDRDRREVLTVDVEEVVTWAGKRKGLWKQGNRRNAVAEVIEGNVGADGVQVELRNLS